MDNELAASASEIADEVIDAFSELHPDIKMSFTQWSDLKEMIEREIRGHYCGDDTHASDLLKKEPS
jgi:hypothetical protein